MTKSVFTPEYRFFRLLLRIERNKTKLGQKALSAMLEMPNSFVCKYEQGERRLDVIELINIAHTLGFDVCKLIRKVERLMIRIQKCNQKKVKK